MHRNGVVSVLLLALCGLASGETCLSGIGVQNMQCPIADNPANPTILAHPICSKFYKCSHGIACELDCPIGQHFNAFTRRCDWPSAACCDPTVPCGSNPVPPPPPPVQPPVAQPTSCTPNAACPVFEDSQRPTHLRHTSCTNFFKCSSGSACLMQCPAGQHYSVQLQRCDWPQVACCDPSLPCQQAPGIVTPMICHNDISCPMFDDPARPVHLRNPSDCNSFYKCLEGRACQVSCPSGQHWSTQLNRCDWPNVACCAANVSCTFGLEAALQEVTV